MLSMVASDFEALCADFMAYVDVLFDLRAQGAEVYQAVDDEAWRRFDPDSVLEAQADFASAWEGADSVLGEMSVLLDSVAYQAELDWFDDSYHLELEEGEGPVGELHELDGNEGPGGVEAALGDLESEAFQGVLDEIHMGIQVDELRLDALLESLAESAELGVEYDADWDEYHLLNEFVGPEIYFSAEELEAYAEEWAGADSDGESVAELGRRPMYDDLEPWDSDNE